MSNPLKCYLAAPWSDRDQAIIAAHRLRAAGFEVTSRWLTHDGDSMNGMDIESTRLQEAALRDIEDVLNSHVMILLNTQPRGHETSGKAVEMGIALVTCKGIIVVGERTNIFHHLGAIPVVPTLDDAIVELKQWKPIEIDLGVTSMLAADRRNP